MACDLTSFQSVRAAGTALSRDAGGASVGGVGWGGVGGVGGEGWVGGSLKRVGGVVDTNKQKDMASLKCLMPSMTLDGRASKEQESR